MNKDGFDRLSAVQGESVHSVPVAEVIRTGGIRPAAPKTKHIFGKMFLDCFSLAVCRRDSTQPSEWVIGPRSA